MDAKLCAVEHAQTQNVEVGAMPRADDLGEARNADPRDLALLATRPDIFAQLGVSQLLQRDVHRLGVVAAVVDPAGGGAVWELLGLDEVLHAQLGLVHAELDRGVGDETLDQVARLRDPKRASIGDAAGCLVRVVTVRRHMRGRDVV